MLGHALLLAGALAIGCGRSETSEPHAARLESASRNQVASPTTAPSTATTSSAEPANDGLDDFKQALARKFDPAQMRTRPASPQGGILNIPNGRADHAAILVKDADGKVRSECVSSSAEVSALVEEVRKGRAP